MKKMWKFLPVFVLSCFFVTGCFSSPEKSLKKASEKMSKLDSYQMTLNLNMGAKSEGIEMEVPITLDTQYNEKSKTGKMDITISIFGMKVTTESYVEYNDSKAITYTKDASSEEWSKQEAEVNVDSSIALNFIDKASKIKKVDSDEKDLTKYQVTVTKEDMGKLLKESMEVMPSDMVASEDSNYEVTKDVVFDVYTKDNYVKKIVIDLLSAIAFKDEEQELTKFTMEFIFDKFNKVEEIKIPEDVKNNAIDEKVKEAKENIESYVSTIEWEYMLEENIPSHVTDIDLDEDIKPTKVDVTLDAEGSVVSGTIVIDGVTGTIKDGEVISVK